MSNTQKIEDYSSYFLVNVAFKWARELRNRKGSNAVMSDLVDEALQDIRGGKVSIDEIINLTIEDHPVKNVVLPAILEGVESKDEEDEKDEKKAKKEKKSVKKKK